MTPWIRFISGAVLGADAPTTCHGGSKKDPCSAATQHPGPDGWKLLENQLPSEQWRNGWWCPACVRDLEEVARENGGSFKRRSIPLAPSGRS